MTLPAAVELSGRAAGVADRLAAWRRGRVTLAELWRVLDEVDPASRADARRRVLLAAVLDELAHAGLLRLPSGRSYDQTETPHLPRFVTLSRSDTSPAPARTVVWHPALSWVPDARLTAAQQDILERLNDWLHTHRDPLVVPLRERSLDIFGHEKTLDRLVPTNLFGPGRLTLDLLRTRRALVRFTTEPVGDGDDLLVVENSDTFDSLVHALRDHAGRHRFRLVGWGAGTAFEASVLSVAKIEPPVRAVAYFGDLDEKGLRIPANAAVLAAAEGLPPVRPAAGLYDALFSLAAPQSGQRKTSPAAAADVTAWLSPRHRHPAMAHLAAGNRLAQEAVGLHYLLNHDRWLREE